MSKSKKTSKLKCGPKSKWKAKTIEIQVRTGLSNKLLKQINAVSIGLRGGAIVLSKTEDLGFGTIKQVQVNYVGPAAAEVGPLEYRE